MVLPVIIKCFTDKCNLHCCHNSYHSRSDFIVNDVEINCTQLALGVSQVQLLCLHAVVGEGNDFWKALFKVIGFVAVHKPNVYKSILRKLKAALRINKWLKRLHKGPVFSPTEANAHLILWRASCDGPPSSKAPPTRC